MPEGHLVKSIYEVHVTLPVAVQHKIAPAVVLLHPPVHILHG